MSAARNLATNTLWNLLGMAGPMIAAIWAIPILIDGLGTERFGLMAIVWMVVGYFSLFDLGLGRALTKMVAERNGTPRQAAIPSIVRRGMRMMWGLGLAGGALVALLAPWLAGHALKMPADLRAEALASLLILAATVPFVIVSAGSVGVLQGLHRFREITWVRLPLGLLNYIAPVIVLGFSHSLVAVTAIVAITRVLAAAVFSWLSTVSTRSLSRTSEQTTPYVSTREMLGFGGWVTVSNVIGPVMVYFDRFLIGAVVGTAAVAYYTTPFEVVSRISLLPSAMLGVLFPALASQFATPGSNSRRLYRQSFHFILLLMAAPVAIAVLFASEGLAFWLGSDFAKQAATCAQWLAIGVFFNSLAGLPFIALQGSGRPDLTAKLHVVELILYLPALWIAIKVWGIAGAAAVWALRNLVDLVALVLLCDKQIPELRAAVARAMMAGVSICAALLALAWLSDLGMRLMIVVAVVAVSGSLLYMAIRHAGLWPIKQRGMA